MNVVNVARIVAATALAAAALHASPAAALEPGQHCTLKAPLSVTIKKSSGTIESPIDVGAEVELVSVSDQGFARIHAGEVSGLVSAADLESACSGSLRMCTLKDEVMMFEENRSDSRSWRVKTGAEVSVLKRGKTWAAVRVGDLQGFVKADDIRGACASGGGNNGDAPVGDDDGTAASANTPTEQVDRGEGPGVLLLPFDLEGAAPAGAADAFLDVLYERTQYYRPDAARVGVLEGRDKPWKERIVEAAKRAKNADTAYVIVGRLSVEAPKQDAPLEERYLLQLAVVDAKTAKVLKGVRVRPTTKAADPWAEKTLAELLPAVRAAPGSRLPATPEGPRLELPKETPDAAPEKPQQHASAAPAQEPTPWFANVWGYALFAGAAAAGAGSGIIGRIALDENTLANNAVQTDPTRAALRNTALGEAITADSLAVVCAGGVVAMVAVFATRAGLE